MANKWINGQYSLGQKEKLAKFKKHCIHGGRGRTPTGDVKLIFWAHNQEAEHSANLGAEKQKKIVVVKCSNSETWKGKKSFWVGIAKENGKSACGVVIKRVRQRQMGDNQQNCGTFNDWYDHGSRNFKSVRATETLDLIFNKGQYSEYQSMR